MYVTVNMIYASNTECYIVQKMLNKKFFQSINQYQEPCLTQASKNPLLDPPALFTLTSILTSPYLLVLSLLNL